MKPTWKPGERYVAPPSEAHANSTHQKLKQEDRQPQQSQSGVVQAAHSTGATLQGAENEIVAPEEPPPTVDGEWLEGPETYGNWGDDCCGCGAGCAGCGGACGDVCGSGCCEPCCQGGIVQSRWPRLQSGSFSVYGWLAQGLTLNPDYPNNRFNGPLTFNDRANEYQLNQMYVVFEDCVDTCGSDWDLGGRLDLLYGTDYFFTTARGLETRRDGSPRWNSDDGPRANGASLYGLAMPQLYAEVFAPIGNGLSIKLGHFYSILGYESVMYPDNFFYSRSYAKQYGEPFTHTGMLANYRLSSDWSLMGGFTRGWNNWEDNNNDLGFLGGVEWCRPDGCESLRFAMHTGNEDDAGENNRTAYSIVYYRQLQSRLAYVFEHNFGVEDNAASRANSQVPAHWYGISQYLVHQVNCETEVGMRVEWFRDEENARVLSIPLEGGVGGNYVAITAGVNYYPSICSGLQVRPELRWDWSDTEFESLGVQGMFDDFSDHDQLTLSLSTSLCF